MPKTYLGDSVYVEILDEGGCIVLTTENGFKSDPSNEIYMEPETLGKLLEFVARDAGKHADKA